MDTNFSPNPTLQTMPYRTIGSQKMVEDILWSTPEQKTGSLRLVGGNLHSFSTIIRLAEYCQTLPIKTVRLTLPDALRNKIPSIDNIDFAPSTTSGSFDKSPQLITSLQNSDLTLLVGDVSKNSATTIALAQALHATDQPVVITRDAIDCITPEISTLLDTPQRIYLATLPQLQKLFRSALYPKMLLLSMPLPPILEVLHKFTLSYPATIITFSVGQIILAHDGKIITLPLEKTPYSPLSLWGGTLAAKIAILNLWHPNQPLLASTAAFYFS